MTSQVLIPTAAAADLVFAHRGQQVTPLRTLEKHGAEPAQQQNDAEDARVPTMDPRHCMKRNGLSGCAGISASWITPIGEENLQDQRIGERGQAEIDARESQRRRADDERGERGTACSPAYRSRVMRPKSLLQHESDIAAKTDESGMAKRQLPGIAADQIPGHSERGPERDQGSETAQVEVGDLLTIAK